MVLQDMVQIGVGFLSQYGKIRNLVPYLYARIYIVLHDRDRVSINVVPFCFMYVKFQSISSLLSYSIITSLLIYTIVHTCTSHLKYIIVNQLLFFVLQDVEEEAMKLRKLKKGAVGRATLLLQTINVRLSRKSTVLFVDT